jgi:hypothetical protein
MERNKRDVRRLETAYALMIIIDRSTQEQTGCCYMETAALKFGEQHLHLINTT